MYIYLYIFIYIYIDINLPVIYRYFLPFTKEACGEIFKVQGGPFNFNCNSEKLLYKTIYMYIYIHI